VLVPRLLGVGEVPNILGNESTFLLAQRRMDQYGGQDHLRGFHKVEHFLPDGQWPSHGNTLLYS
jgi:hypothetical protein